MKQERQARQNRTRPKLSAPREQTASTAPATPPQASPEPLISSNRQGQLTVSEAGWEKIRKSFLGSSPLNEAELESNSYLKNSLFAQVAGAVPYAKGDGGAPVALNFALEAVASLAPRDGLEVMLCSQLVALHSQSMEYLRRGMEPEQTHDGADRSVNRAAKLLRTFAILAECLRTHRGGGQQKMIVEHVTVQAGGQAIVGTVNRGEGGGDGQQNCE